MQTVQLIQSIQAASLLPAPLVAITATALQTVIDLQCLKIS
jgi:hypothetical protein